MPRKTKAQIGLLLADLFAAKRDKAKAERRVDELTAELGAIPNLKEGTYGEYTYGTGTAREILDQQAAKELIKSLGKAVPTKLGSAPIVIKPVVK
jgi:hypothetical protein